jgi:hypothetical protein
MDPDILPVTWITATILATVTKDRYPSAESRRSTTSTRTKLGMGGATSLRTPATTRTKSTAPDIRREDPAANTVKEGFNEVKRALVARGCAGLALHRGVLSRRARSMMGMASNSVVPCREHVM